MQWQRLGVWIVLAIAACTALGAWLGSHLGDGGTGMMALIAAAFGVLGSFLPGSVIYVRARLRRPDGPNEGTA